MNYFFDEYIIKLLLSKSKKHFTYFYFVTSFGLLVLVLPGPSARTPRMATWAYPRRIFFGKTGNGLNIKILKESSFLEPVRLKDVALVVVGFYFGTQKKTNETIHSDTKITSTEETHE